MSKEYQYRYNCIENNAVVGQGDETVRDYEDGRQQGVAHCKEEGVASGQHEEQHAEGVAKAGKEYEGLHNLDGGPGGLRKEQVMYMMIKNEAMQYDMVEYAVKEGKIR